MQDRFDAQLDRLTSSQGRRSGFLLALSGGVDSMTMAHLFLHSPLARGCRLVVAHVNFSLRGAESDADEALVRDWAAAHGLACKVRCFDTESYAAEHGCSIEMAARDLRYGWFRELLAQEQLAYVAVAHHLNDSAETLFLNLLRGTGLRGLSGIRPINGSVIRPMLPFSRDEILAFARTSGIAFREDATNADCRFARNRIRQAVFPEFARINPAFLQNLAGSMKHFAEAQAILDGDFAKRAPAFSHWEGDALTIDRKALLAEPFLHYWLFRSLEPFGFKPTQVDAVEASLVKGHCGSRFYSATHVALRDRAGLKIYPLVRPEKDEPPFCARIAERPTDFDPRSVPAGILCADADKLTLPLQFRRWQSGDRFRPLGMQGFRKLSDFFIDQKLDLEQKARQVVVTTRTPEGRERIVAVAGLRIDDRVRVTEATRTLVWIEPSR